MTLPGRAPSLTECTTFTLWGKPGCQADCRVDETCTKAAWDRSSQAARCDCPSLLRSPHEDGDSPDDEISEEYLYESTSGGSKPVASHGASAVAGAANHSAPVTPPTCNSYDPAVFTALHTEAYFELRRSPFWFIRKIDPKAKLIDEVNATEAHPPIMSRRAALQMQRAQQMQRVKHRISLTSGKSLL